MDLIREVCLVKGKYLNNETTIQLEFTYCQNLKQLDVQKVMVFYVDPST